jgi:hypothetical protein
VNKTQENGSKNTHATAEQKSVKESAERPTAAKKTTEKLTPAKKNAEKHAPAKKNAERHAPAKTRATDPPGTSQAPRQP